MSGYCSIHKSIDTGQKCAACFDSWPKEKKVGITRPICKRKNWVGRADCEYENPDPKNRVSIPEIM